MVKMEREIKFRGWCDGEMNYDHSEVFYWLHLDRNSEDNNTVFMQFTGIRDKNGVEVYQSDILETESGKCVVVWFVDGACFRYKFGENLESPLNYDGVEVIGNIFQNPELLTVKNDTIPKLLGQ